MFSILKTKLSAILQINIYYLYKSIPNLYVFKKHKLIYRQTNIKGVEK